MKRHESDALRTARLFVSGLVLSIAAMISATAIALTPEEAGQFVGRNITMPPKLSPDGEHVVTFVRTDGRWSVVAMKLTDRSTVLSLGMGEFRIRWAKWLNNDTIILAVSRSDGYWSDSWYNRKFFTVSLKKKRPVEIMESLKGVPNNHAEIFEPWEPGRASFGAGDMLFYPRDFGNRADDHHMVLRTGEQTLVTRYDVKKELFKAIGKIDGDARTIFTNRKGHVLAGFGYPSINYRSAEEREAHKDNRQLWYRSNANDDFQITRRTQVDSGDVRFVGRSANPKQAMILDHVSHDIQGLGVFDVTDGSIKPVFRAARADVWEVQHDADGEVIVVRYDDHYPDWKYPNSKHPGAQLHAVLSKGFANQSVKLISFSDDNKKATVQVITDKNPGTYYVVDVASRKAQVLSKQSNTQATGNRFPIEFASRDGARLTGYVTLPNGKEKNLPFVVLIKGGPSSLPGGRIATWDFDGEAQLFASHGIGVLQVNYRGTDGLGLAHASGAMGDWNGAPQNDVIDGVRYIIANGTADSGRICVYGEGFGAHAALVQAAMEQDLYQCAIAVRGNYDMGYTFSRIRVKSAKERYAMIVSGKPGASRPDMEELSATSAAQRIKIPVMLLEGRRNNANPSDQIRRMQSALTDAGVSVTSHYEHAESADIPLNYKNRRQGLKTIYDFVVAHTGA